MSQFQSQIKLLQGKSNLYAYIWIIILGPVSTVLLGQHYTPMVGGKTLGKVCWPASAFDRMLQALTFKL